MTDRWADLRFERGVEGDLMHLHTVNNHCGSRGCVQATEELEHKVCAQRAATVAGKVFPPSERQRLTENMAERVWVVLVEECGANPSADAKWEFVHHQTREHCSEYRFQGKLGFGGKLWNNSLRLSVNCYPEDLTDERGEIMMRANARLKLIAEER